MSAAPPNNNNNTQGGGFILCYTVNGQPISIYSATGSCPMGFFSKPPEPIDPFSESEAEEAFEEEEVEADTYTTCYSVCDINGFSQGRSYINVDSCPADYPFETQEDCDKTDDYNPNLVKVCHSPCVILSGESNQSTQSVSVYGTPCPDAYPFETKPTCVIPDDVQLIIDQYNAQIAALDALLAEAMASNDSQEALDLAAEIEALKAQIDSEASQGGGGGGGFPTPTKQAGLGDIPNWAIIGGVTLVAIIAIISRRRPQPVVAKG